MKVRMQTDMSETKSRFSTVIKDTFKNEGVRDRQILTCFLDSRIL